MTLTHERTYSAEIAKRIHRLLQWRWRTTQRGGVVTTEAPSWEIDAAELQVRRRDALPARNTAIFTHWRDDPWLTLENLARDFGLTRERIRQILRSEAQKRGGDYVQMMADRARQR